MLHTRSISLADLKRPIESYTRSRFSDNPPQAQVRAQYAGGQFTARHQADSEEKAAPAAHDKQRQQQRGDPLQILAAFRAG